MANKDFVNKYRKVAGLEFESLNEDKITFDVLSLSNKDASAAAPNTDIKFPNDKKVTVPAEVKSAVKEAVKRAKEDAAKAQARDTVDGRTGLDQPADVNRYVDLLNAYDKIEKLLDDRSENAVKELQIFMTSLANWMTKEFPPALVKWIANPTPITLRDRMEKIKAHKSKGM